MINMERRITILDTTMRDGEQSPGAIMTAKHKLDIAMQLDRLGVDVIEAGLPANSRYEVAAVKAVAREVRRPVICALARAVPNDIDAAWEAIQGAERARLHVMISSSDEHIINLLHKDRGQIMKMAVDGVRRAKSYCEDVEFSPMDATRTDADFLYQLLEAVIQEGATTVNIADTVGIANPRNFARRIRGVFDNVPNIRQAQVSVHCHNDLGNAVSNSTAAVEAGANQVEGCINGLGERAGNAALEEVVMNLHTDPDFVGVVTTGIDTKQIYPISRLVSQITGIPVQPNKAIVGANAFAHESGIHQDGVIKKRSTFEIMDPGQLGIERSNSGIVLGKTSGRAGFAGKIREMGFTPDGGQFDSAYAEFKRIVEQGGRVTEEEIRQIIAGA